VTTQTGVLKGRRRRAVDSTILAAAVATQDTITQLVSAIRRVARLVPVGGSAGGARLAAAGPAAAIFLRRGEKSPQTPSRPRT
jgi:hypothetical protein